VKTYEFEANPDVEMRAIHQNNELMSLKQDLAEKERRLCHEQNQVSDLLNHINIDETEWNANSA